MKKILHFIAKLEFHAAVFIILILFANSIQAQNNWWVSQPITPISANKYFHTCADECCAFVCDNKASIYYFDIKTSHWTEYPVPNNEKPNKLVGADHVFMAIGDSSLIGYSSILQQVNFRRFSGNPVNFYFKGQTQNFGCLGKLCTFLTDKYLYVFDAELGSWQVQDYSLLPNYISTGNLYMKDDYMMVYFTSNSNARPIILIYNLLQHTFIYITDGVYPSIVMDHGFAGVFSTDPEAYYIGGYSVFTNNYAHDLITGQWDQVNSSSRYMDTDIYGEQTAYAITFRKAIQPIPTSQVMFYIFETQRGSWSTWTATSDESLPYIADLGGRFVVSLYYDKSGITGFLTYNEINNNFNILYPNLIYDAGYSIVLKGGKVFAEQDANKLWAYDFVGQAQSDVANPFNAGSNYAAAEDFLSICRFSYYENIMKIFFYNGQKNSWKSAETWKAQSDYYKISRNVYNLTVPNPSFTESQVTFYSPILDSIVQKILPGTSSTGASNNFLSYTGTTGKSFFFDARNARVDEFGFNFGYPGLTDSAAFFLDPTVNKLYGYSSMSQLWTIYQPSQTINQREIKEFIGIAASAYQAKVYAYNSFMDQVTEFTPAGSAKTLSVGGKTALLVRNDIIYAYDPGISPATNNNKPGSSDYKLLIINSPNPFNLSTTLFWQQPGSGQVILKIFDFMGNEIRTLLDKEMPSGEHRLEFDSSGLAAGVYFCRLQAGNHSAMVKMIIIK